MVRSNGFWKFWVTVTRDTNPRTSAVTFVLLRGQSCGCFASSPWTRREPSVILSDCAKTWVEVRPKNKQTTATGKRRNPRNIQHSKCLVCELLPLKGCVRFSL